MIHVFGWACFHLSNLYRSKSGMLLQDDVVSVLPIRCKMFQYLCRISYMLQNMSASLSLMVVAAYWILLGRYYAVTCLAIQQHGVTSCGALGLLRAHLTIVLSLLGSTAPMYPLLGIHAMVSRPC